MPPHALSAYYFFRPCTSMREHDVTAVTEELGSDQRQVLQAVYDALKVSNSWPKFSQVDRKLYRKGRLDVARVSREIPETLLQSIGSRDSYIHPDTPMRLTLTGISACNGSVDTVGLFLRTLRWIAKRERTYQPGSDAVTGVLQVSARQLMRGFRFKKERFGDVLTIGELMQVEQWGWVSGGSGSTNEPGWTFAVSRDVRRFRDVRSLDDYLQVKQQWREESIAPPSQRSSVDALPYFFEQPAEVAVSSYIDQAVIEIISSKREASQWNCDKLLQLIGELNDNYASRNTYSAHAMLRAILDHIPPIFDCHSFTEVANNHLWGRTDKGYIKRLLDLRLQGDDALHRQISTKADFLRFEDLPPGTWLNILLQECAGHL